MTKQRILVVDDDDSIRQALEIALTKAGYEVLQARDGEEATRWPWSSRSWMGRADDLEAEGSDGRWVIPRWRARCLFPPVTSPLPIN